MYVAYYKQVFLNELKKLVDDDLHNFTFVPEAVKKNERKLLDECKNRKIDIGDIESVHKLAREMGLSDDELKALREWMLKKIPVSADEQITDDEGNGCSVIDSMEDKDVKVEEQAVGIVEAKKRFEFIKKVFRLKQFPAWKKSLVTQRLYEDLHKFFENTGEPIERYTFIDMAVYNLKDAPNQRDIARMTGKDPSQLTKAWDALLGVVKSEWDKVPADNP